MAATVRRKLLMSDGVHAAVNAVQAPRGHGTVYRPIRVSEPAHLLPRHDSVVLLCDARESMMRSLLSLHTEDKCERMAISPPCDGVLPLPFAVFVA